MYAHGEINKVSKTSIAFIKYTCLVCGFWTWTLCRRVDLRLSPGTRLWDNCFDNCSIYSSQWEQY